jgi:hypothetical protein
MSAVSQRPSLAERAVALSRPAVAVTALTVLAAALRFPTLADQSYWLDEAVTVHLIRLPFGDMLSAIPGSESTPPLYYAVAWVWRHLIGSGEADLRSLSALAGTATVPLAYLAAARLVGARAGVIVAALAAVNPLLVWYSQEARAYALLVLLTTAALAVYALLLERPTGRRLASWAVLSALALATHYFAIFVIAPQLLWLAWRWRGARERRAVLAAGGAVALAGAALLPLMIEQAGNDRADFIRSLDLAGRIAQVPKQYLVGFDGPLEAASAVVALCLAAFGLWLLWKRAEGRELSGARKAARVAVPALAVPVVLALVGIDYVVTRNLIAAWVPAAIVVAAGLGARRAGRLGVGAAVALCAVSLAVVIGVATGSEYQRGDWRGVSDALGPIPGVGRALVISPALGSIPLSLYTPNVNPFPDTWLPVSAIDVVAVAERRIGQTPAPPHPRTLPPPPPGFEPPTVKRTPSYTLVHYPAGGGVAWVNPPLVASLRLTRRVGDVSLQLPPGTAPPAAGP